jgi:Leucine-rich repeat (LRR) protein
MGKRANAPPPRDSSIRACDTRCILFFFLCVSYPIVSDSSFSAYLKEIKEIDLSFNRIERIPNGIGNLSTLTCLKLQNNRIEKIPHYIGRLHVLKHLNLSHNLILEVPPDFKRLQKLETLDLSMQVCPKLRISLLSKSRPFSPRP